MKKKVIVFLGVLLLFNVVVVYAATGIHGYYLGYEKVKVVVDGEEIKSSVPPLILDNTTMVPLRSIAEKLDVIVKWNEDNQEAILIKPNVNMQFTANPIYDKSKNTYVVYSPFGKIPKDKRSYFTFYVYSEVDNLPRESVQVKVALRDPDGGLVKEGVPLTFDASQENSLQYISSFEDITFLKTGNYYVEFLLKSDSTKNTFTKIGEKNILVK